MENGDFHQVGGLKDQKFGGNEEVSLFYTKR